MIVQKCIYNPSSKTFNSKEDLVWCCKYPICITEIRLLLLTLLQLFISTQWKKFIIYYTIFHGGTCASKIRLFNTRDLSLICFLSVQLGFQKCHFSLLLALQSSLDIVCLVVIAILSVVCFLLAPIVEPTMFHFPVKLYSISCKQISWCLHLIFWGVLVLFVWFNGLISLYTQYWLIKCLII